MSKKHPIDVNQKFVMNSWPVLVHGGGRLQVGHCAVVRL